jgi:hypothetical protein
MLLHLAAEYLRLEHAIVPKRTFTQSRDGKPGVPHTSASKGESIVRVRLLAFAFTALLPMWALAQGTPDPAEEEEIRFEESIRNFGYLSGQTYQCLPEGERTAHDREVMKAFSGLVRLFGSDRAFFYAAAFGAGTGASIDKAKCADYIADFRAAMKAGGRSQ